MSKTKKRPTPVDCSACDAIEEGGQPSTKHALGHTTDRRGRKIDPRDMEPGKKPLVCAPLGWCGGDGTKSCPIHGDPPTLGDERAFLVVLSEIIEAAIHVIHKAHDPGRGGIYRAHPWLRVRDEVFKRLKDEGGDPTGMFGFERFRRDNEKILRSVYRAYEAEIDEGKRKR